MSVLIDLLGTLPKFMGRLWERHMKEAMTFSVRWYDAGEEYDLEDEFFPVEVTFYPGLDETSVKSIYAKGCAVCWDEGYMADCGGIGEIRFRRDKSVVAYERFDIGMLISPKVAIKGGVKFIFWIRPPKGAKEIKIMVLTDRFLPPPPRTLQVE